MPPNYPDNFFEVRESSDETVEKEILDEDTYLNESVDPIPLANLNAEDNDWLVPAHTIELTKCRRRCQYLQPADDIQPVMVDHETGCTYYMIKERCWDHFMVYLVFGPDEYLWFEFDGPDLPTTAKLVRFCPDGTATDLGDPAKDRRFFPVGNKAPIGWLPPSEGGWIVSHGYGEKRYKEKNDVCVLVLYTFVRQVPIVIENGVMTARYKLMAKIEKRKCRTRALLQGYPRFEEIEGSSEVPVSWPVNRQN